MLQNTNWTTIVFANWKVEFSLICQMTGNWQSNSLIFCNAQEQENEGLHSVMNFNILTPAALYLKPHVYVSVAKILIRNNDNFHFMISTKTRIINSKTGSIILTRNPVLNYGWIIISSLSSTFIVSPGYLLSNKCKPNESILILVYDWQLLRSRAKV